MCGQLSPRHLFHGFRETRSTWRFPRRSSRQRVSAQRGPIVSAHEDGPPGTRVPTVELEKVR